MDSLFNSSNRMHQQQRALITLTLVSFEFDAWCLM